MQNSVQVANHNYYGHRNTDAVSYKVTCYTSTVGCYIVLHYSSRFIFDAVIRRQKTVFMCPIIHYIDHMYMYSECHEIIAATQSLKLISWLLYVQFTVNLLVQTACWVAYATR